MKMEAMDGRFDQRLSNEGRASVGLQRKLIETRRTNSNTSQLPDLTDLMNDMFFGSTSSGNLDNKIYNINGGRGRALIDRDEDDFDSSTRSVNSRMTQEWLEEAKRMVVSSPTRGGDSPSRLVASPRFAASQGRLSTSSLEKRDPFSRSARRHRAPDGFSGEILSRTANHIRNNSESNMSPPEAEQLSPVSEIQKWISNNVKLPNSPEHTEPTPPSPTSSLGAPPLPPRQSIHRRTRFQTESKSPLSHQIPPPTNLPAISKRTFKNTDTSTNNNAHGTTSDTHVLSPPKHPVESTHRRSRSTSSSSIPDSVLLSPPRNLVESAHRRSISSSTCRTDKIVQKEDSDDWQFKNGGQKSQDFSGFLKDKEFNGFLKEQRIKIEKLLSGEINGKAKIVLSGPSNSTSSMVAATCYAWLLENKNLANKKEGGRNDNKHMEFVVPVMNTRREKMWKMRQVAWLFHHVRLDATSLLFSNEVELETLMMAKQLSILVVGEDILKTNSEVGSPCTVLTDNYCEDAYDLLQTPILKKLLMAGILLDTQNLSPSRKLSIARDARHFSCSLLPLLPTTETPFLIMMQDHRDDSFFEALQQTYGKPPSEINWDNGAATNRRISEKVSSNDVVDAGVKKVSPLQGKPAPSPVKATVKEPAKTNEAPRGKNRNFFAKLFGFGSK